MSASRARGAEWNDILGVIWPTLGLRLCTLILGPVAHLLLQTKSDWPHTQIVLGSWNKNQLWEQLKDPKEKAMGRLDRKKEEGWCSEII